MKPGDILRLRKVETFGAMPGDRFTFVPDKKDKKFKRVFVCIYLGTEGFEIENMKGEKLMEPLNCDCALNRLGWISEQQLLKAKPPKGFLERLKEVFKEK